MAQFLLHLDYYLISILEVLINTNNNIHIHETNINDNNMRQLQPRTLLSEHLNYQRKTKFKLIN